MPARARFAAGLPILALLYGCPGSTPGDPPPTARVMAVQASPDAPTVILMLNNDVVTRDLDFPENTTYFTVEARPVQFWMYPVTDVYESVVDTSAMLEPGQNLTFWAVDFLGSIEPMITIEDLTTPARGKTHVRFLQLSPDSPSLDLALDDGDVLFGGYAFRRSSAFVPLDAGVYDLELRVAGTDSVAFDLDPLTLQAQKIYTLWTRGSAASPPVGGSALGVEVLENN